MSHRFIPLMLGFAWGLSLSVASIVSVWAGPSPPSQVVNFGFVCAKPMSPLPPGAESVVAALMREHHSDGVRPWGDRAVVILLHGDKDPIYFVPLSCGATGNCTWGIVAPSPTRSIGIVSAAVIRIEVGGSAWPEINGYYSTGAGQGELEQFAFNGTQYRRRAISKLTPNGVGQYAPCVDNEACCPGSAT